MTNPSEESMAEAESIAKASGCQECERYLLAKAIALALDQAKAEGYRQGHIDHQLAHEASTRLWQMACKRKMKEDIA